MTPWQVYRHELCELCPIWHMAKTCPKPRYRLYPIRTKFPLHVSLVSPCSLLCLQLALIKTELELCFVYFLCILSLVGGKLLLEL